MRKTAQCLYLPYYKLHYKKREETDNITIPTYTLPHCSVMFGLLFVWTENLACLEHLFGGNVFFWGLSVCCRNPNKSLPM